VGGDGPGVQPGERADRERLPVQRLGVRPDLLQRDDLADLDVALAGDVLRQRRASRVLAGDDDSPLPFVQAVRISMA
jgi:hypothetical protein